MKSIVRSWRMLGYGCIALFTIGCSELPSVVVPLNDYQERVANTLNSEPIPFTATAYPRLPDVRDLRTDVPRVSVSLLDSWRLDQCAVGQLIAQRNSALGKLEDGVSRYFTDRKLAQALQDCVIELEQAGEQQLATRLAKAAAEKRATLSASRQLALATDDALRHTLSLSATTLNAADAAAFATSLAALDQVIAVLSEPADEALQISHTELESALQQLHQADYLPRFWRSLHTLNAYLEQLSSLLEDLSTRAGCNSKGTPERAAILHTVFLKYFIQNVQTQLAGFTQQGYLLQERLSQLAALSTQPQLTSYLRQLSHLTDKVNEQSKKHVEPWQHFFEACGFQPG